MMVRKNPGVDVPAHALQQRRGPLNIGEQEGEHPHGHSVGVQARQQQQPDQRTPGQGLSTPRRGEAPEF
jgi:hypothetical protein